MSYQAMEKHEKKLKCILLSEKRQYEETTQYIIPIIWYFGKGKTMNTIQRSVVERGWQGRDEQIAKINFGSVKILSMIL